MNRIRKVLYVVPKVPGDTATQYSYDWWIPIREKAMKAFPNGYSELLKEDATREKVLAEIPKADYISHVDHGAPDGLGGAGKKKIIDVNDAGIFKDKVFHTFSCSSGKEFCPAITDTGCLASHGYTDVVGFSLLGFDAKNFGKYFTTFEDRLLDGLSYKDALIEAKETANNVTKYMSPLGKYWLRHDVKNETIFGDGDTRIVGVREKPPLECKKIISELLWLTGKTLIRLSDNLSQR